MSAYGKGDEGRYEHDDEDRDDEDRDDTQNFLESLRHDDDDSNVGRDSRLLDDCQRFLFETLRLYREPRFHGARTPMSDGELWLRLPPKLAELHRANRRRLERVADDPSGGYWLLLEAYEDLMNLAAWVFSGIIFVRPEPVYNDMRSPIGELEIMTHMIWLYLREFLRKAADEDE